MNFLSFFQQYLIENLQERKARGYEFQVDEINYFQVVFHPNGRHEVRIHDEVEGNAMIHSPNSAWATLTRLDSDNWSVAFDLSYNKRKRRDYVDAAKEYVESSKMCSQRGLDRPFVDNLYSAVELLSKALLIEFPQKKEKITHGTISARLNMRAQRAIIGSEYAPLLNRLEKLRKNARYLEGALILSLQDKVMLIKQAEQFHKMVAGRC